MCVFWASRRFAYCPADATASHCLLLQEIQIGFCFTVLVPAHPGSPGQNPESRKTVVIVVVVVVCVLGIRSYVPARMSQQLVVDKVRKML